MFPPLAGSPEGGFAIRGRAKATSHVSAISGNGNDSGSGNGSGSGSGRRSLFRKNKRNVRDANSNQKDGGHGKQKGKRGRGETRNQNSSRRSRPRNARNGARKSHSQEASESNELEHSNSHSSSAESCLSRSASYEPASPPKTNDPLARRIYETLHAEGIAPPQWPLNPGDPRNNKEMSKFREIYEKYRHRARASLVKAGLIDDPDKRKRLSEALDFKGICEDMCPEYEKVTRISEYDVNKPERDQMDRPHVRKMVKKLARSAAGQEAPLPMDVRSVPALQRTLDYLIDFVLERDEKLTALHPFLWDRTRAIRRDFAFFSSLTAQEVKTQIHILEKIARFHVTSLHLLSQRGKADETFVEQQEVEQLSKTLLSLRDLYDDCNENDITCDNEAEFRAYYLLFHGRDVAIVENLQRQWQSWLWDGVPEVKAASSLAEALHVTYEFVRKDGNSGPLMAAEGNPLSYSRIMEDVGTSYTMACFAECHLPHIRHSILAAIKRALSRPKDPVQDLTAAELNDFLRFDAVEEAIEFAKLHGLEIAPNEQDPTDAGRQFVVLNDKAPLPYVRVSHQFSQILVERKRGPRPLPHLIHYTIYEDEPVAEEESMFVEDDEESEVEPSTMETEKPANELTPAETSRPSRGPRKVSLTNQSFLVESDSEGGDQEPRPGGSAAAPTGPPRFPTFEEVKARDSGNYLNDAARLSRFSASGQTNSASNSTQPAKPNPFATRLQLPSSMTGKQPEHLTAEQPNPLILFPGQGVGENVPSQVNPASVAATTNPFAGPINLGSGEAASGGMALGGSVQAQPTPFSSVSQADGSGRAAVGESPNHNLVQPKPGPFAPPASASQPGGIGQAAGDGPRPVLGQPRPNPFAPLAAASRLNISGQEAASPNHSQPRLNPFAPLATASRPNISGLPAASESPNYSLGQPKPNPFASLATSGQPTAYQAASLVAPGQPRANTVALSAPGQPKPNQFAPPSVPESSAATSTSNTSAALSGAPSDGNAAQRPVPAAAAPPALAPRSALKPSATGQNPSLNSTSPTVGSRDKKQPLPALGTKKTVRFAPVTESSPSSLLASAEQPGTEETLGTAPEPTSSSKDHVSPTGSEQHAATTTSTAKPPSEADKEPAKPPRDLLGEFNEWFVKGDNGIMSEFLVAAVELVTKEAFEIHQREVEEEKRREEEGRTNAEVERFRVYNLSLKFFYRWKRNARAKRLREVARKNRDEMRAYHATRRAKEREARKEAELQTKEGELARKRATEPAATKRSQEFMSMIKSKREARDSLLASGVLSGVENAREAAKMIVGDDAWSVSSQAASKQSIQSSPGPAKKGAQAMREFSCSQPLRDENPADAKPTKKEGPKTRALRQMFFDQPEGFRRSLPSMRSRKEVTPDSTKRRTNASSHWMLRAMGIVPLPDGTAVPENLAGEWTPSGLRHSHSVTEWRSRRLSATEALETEMRRGTGSASSGGESMPSKRKRSLDGDDEGAVKSGSTGSNSSKRVLAEAERLCMAADAESPTNKGKRYANDDDEEAAENDDTEAGRLIRESRKARMQMKAYRAELEEGTGWYRAHNDRFRSGSEARRRSWRDGSV